jgi:hypothetical protein
VLLIIFILFVIVLLDGMLTFCVVVVADISDDGVVLAVLISTVCSPRPSNSIETSTRV